MTDEPVVKIFRSDFSGVLEKSEWASKFREAALPLVNFLKENNNPKATVTVTSDSADFLSNIPIVLPLKYDSMTDTTSPEAKAALDDFVVIPKDAGTRLGEQFLRTLFNGMTPFETVMNIIAESATERFKEENETLRRVLQSNAVPEWMPIETAPKDNTTPILARVMPNPEKWCHAIIHWEPSIDKALADDLKLKFGQWYEGPMPLIGTPTHWTHLLPAPPLSSNEPRNGE
jgi:hypothetical protein